MLHCQRCQLDIAPFGSLLGFSKEAWLIFPSQIFPSSRLIVHFYFCSTPFVPMRCVLVPWLMKPKKRRRTTCEQLATSLLILFVKFGRLPLLKVMNEKVSLKWQNDLPNRNYCRRSPHRNRRVNAKHPSGRYASVFRFASSCILWRDELFIMYSSLAGRLMFRLVSNLRHVRTR